jgi:hypothetical protein
LASRVGSGGNAYSLASYFSILVRNTGQRTGTSKVHSKVARETTKKLVYVYSNRKLVSKIEDTNKLKMFAWDKLNEDV